MIKYYYIFFHYRNYWRIGLYRPGFYHTNELSQKFLEIIAHQPNTNPGDIARYYMRLEHLTLIKSYATLDEVVLDHFEKLL